MVLPGRLQPVKAVCNCGAAARNGFHRKHCPATAEHVRSVGVEMVGEEGADQFVQIFTLAADVLELVSSKAERDQIHFGAALQGLLWAAIMAARTFAKQSMTPAQQNAQLRRDLEMAISVVDLAISQGWFRGERVVQS